MLTGIRKVKILLNKTINRLYFSSLHENILLFLSKLLNQSFYHYYSSESEVLRSKHSKPTLLIDRVLRYIKIINNHYELKIDCEDKTFLEIGAGPLLGWGPMASILKSKKYYIIEPSFRKNTVESKKIKEKYFFNHYMHLKNVFNSSISFDQFYNNLNKSIKVFPHINNLSKSEDIKFDFIISNSVIEHISDIENFLLQLSKYDNLNTQHIHCIDFSNHSTGIYDYSKSKSELMEDYKDLNFLKPSEIMSYFERIFKKKFIFVKYLSSYKNLSSELHSDWKRYNADDLETLTGFIISNNHNA